MIGWDIGSGATPHNFILRHQLYKYHRNCCMFYQYFCIRKISYILVYHRPFGYLQGAKQRVTDLEKKSKSRLQVRQIRKFDEDFNTKQFAETAQDIYIESHKLLEK